LECTDIVEQLSSRLDSVDVSDICEDDVEILENPDGHKGLDIFDAILEIPEDIPYYSEIIKDFIDKKSISYIEIETVDFIKKYPEQYFCIINTASLNRSNCDWSIILSLNEIIEKCPNNWKDLLRFYEDNKKSDIHAFKFYFLL
jgi:hypothetical protein